MAKACYRAGFDVLAWSFRGCGDEMNRQLRFYHSGATDDLSIIVNYAISLNQYNEINLIGFSLGGNISLKYAGEGMPQIIKKVVALSVPMDLKTSCEKLSQPANRIYSNRFLKSLKNKIIIKSRLMEGLDITDIENITTLREFDDRYTAPLHGFRDANDYYDQCSALKFINDILVPTLVINAKNDPFLSTQCFPYEQLKNHPFVIIESPDRGGHVGFSMLYSKGVYWSEHRTVTFLNN
jgi:predicted alpha/beta-fold hydrolase